MRYWPLVCSIPVVIGCAWLGAPRPAAACSPDDCSFIDVDDPIASPGDTVASDGVIVLWLIDEYGGPSPDAVSVEVLPSGGGEPVAGVIEHDLELEILVFRPDAPLAPGSYDVNVVTAESDCFPAGDQTFTVEVVAEILPAAIGPSPTSTVEYDTTEVVQLDTIVCCDDAAPTQDSCGGVYNSTGSCVSAVDRGWLHVDIDAAPGLTAVERSNVVVRRTVEGNTAVLPAGTTTLQLTRDEPFCVLLELVHVAQGEVVAAEELCFESAEGEPLGLFEIDPRPELEATCTGVPYVCEATDWEWNLGQCMAFPTGDDDGGTGDTGDDSGVFGEDSGSDGTGGDSSPPAATGDDSGCACATTPAGGRDLAWWALAWVLARRSRTPRARHRASAGASSTT